MAVVRILRMRGRFADVTSVTAPISAPSRMPLPLLSPQSRSAVAGLSSWSYQYWKRGSGVVHVGARLGPRTRARFEARISFRPAPLYPYMILRSMKRFLLRPLSSGSSPRSAPLMTPSSFESSVRTIVSAVDW